MAKTATKKPESAPKDSLLSEPEFCARIAKTPRWCRRHRGDGDLRWVSVGKSPCYRESYADDIVRHGLERANELYDARDAE